MTDNNHSQGQKRASLYVCLYTFAHTDELRLSIHYKGEEEISLHPVNYNTSAASITQPSIHTGVSQTSIRQTASPDEHRRSDFDSVR